MFKARFRALADSLATLLTQLQDVRTLLVKMLVEQQKFQTQIAQLEKRLEEDRRADREFITSILHLLAKPQQQQVVRLSMSSYSDPFAELPLEHPDGFTKEELGIYGAPKVAEEAAGNY